MATTAMTYRSTKSKKPYKQEQLIELQRLAGDKISDIIHALGLDLRHASRFYVGPCPVHGGENKSAFNIFHTGHEVIGNWRCFTHNCHKIFQPTIIGFVRGYLSRTKYGWSGKQDFDKQCPFWEAVEFVQNVVGINEVSDIYVDFDAVEQRRFCSNIKNVFARPEVKRSICIPRESMLRCINIPAQYFVSRGFKQETLIKYDVGFCDTPGKEMFGRAVAPIYDESRKNVVGCTGRSVFDLCPICLSYHNPTSQCPHQKDLWKFSKWRHNLGFHGEENLYNYWFAHEHIQKEKYAIIVESPGNVWRLEEAGFHTGLGTFGAHLTPGQRYILDKSGALALIVLTDCDEAGRLAREEIHKNCMSTYSMYLPNLNFDNDIAELKPEILRERLYPTILKIKHDLGIL